MIYRLSSKFSKKWLSNTVSLLAVELLPLQHFIPAEDYHQDYLKKNPNGYCHINVNQAASPVIDASAYHKPNREELKESLSPEAYAVTQENGTERAFTSPLWNQFEPGIYVDVATGEPLSFRPRTSLIQPVVGQVSLDPLVQR